MLFQLYRRYILDLISENMDGQRLKIKKQIIHPKYINGFKDWNVDYDIAVLITENIGKSIDF